MQAMRSPFGLSWPFSSSSLFSAASLVCAPAPCRESDLQPSGAAIVSITSCFPAPSAVTAPELLLSLRAQAPVSCFGGSTPARKNPPSHRLSQRVGRFRQAVGSVGRHPLQRDPQGKFPDAGRQATCRVLSFRRQLALGLLGSLGMAGLAAVCSSAGSQSGLRSQDSPSRSALAQAWTP